jgi:hypothetical protein
LSDKNKTPNPDTEGICSVCNKSDCLLCIEGIPEETAEEAFYEDYYSTYRFEVEVIDTTVLRGR